MEDALGAPQADVDKFYYMQLRRTKAAQVGMSTAVTAPQREVDQTVGAASTVFRQDKALVLQEHISTVW
jgi:hypothetical protein